MQSGCLMSLARSCAVTEAVTGLGFRVMLSCRRFGGGRQGRTLPARLTGVKGVYYRLLMHSNTKCLTREARKVYFAKALPLTYHNAPWTELAQNRTAWRKFANSARPR